MGNWVLSRSPPAICMVQVKHVYIPISLKMSSEFTQSILSTPAFPIYPPLLMEKVNRQQRSVVICYVFSTNFLSFYYFFT